MSFRTYPKWHLKDAKGGATGYRSEIGSVSTQKPTSGGCRHDQECKRLNSKEKMESSKQGGKSMTFGTSGDGKKRSRWKRRRDVPTKEMVSEVCFCGQDFHTERDSVEGGHSWQSRACIRLADQSCGNITPSSDKGCQTSVNLRAEQLGTLEGFALGQLS